MGLRSRFLLLLGTLACVGMGYLHFLVVPQIGTQILAQSERAHLSQLYLAAEAITPPLLESDLANVYETLNAISYDNPDWLQLILYSPSGDRLYPLSEPRLFNDRPYTLRLESKVGFLDPAIAQLQVVVDMAPSVAIADRLENSLLVVLSLLVFSLLLVVWWEIERVIRRPLGQLVSAAHRLMRGDFSAKLPTRQGDEIAELTHVFSDMRSTIERHHININAELETQRRLADRLKLAKQQAEFEATHDALTGLLNRREFHRQLELSLHEIRQQPALQHTLLYIDLDRFKAVNDTCGHHAGDQLLIQVTEQIQSQIRGEDLYARLGGDEFAILLRGCDISNAERLANSICESIRRFTFSYEAHDFSIGSSIGVAALQIHQSLESLLTTADTACYQAKQRGRGQAVVAPYGLTLPADVTDPSAQCQPSQASPQRHH